MTMMQSMKMSYRIEYSIIEVEIYINLHRSIQVTVEISPVDTMLSSLETWIL